MDTATTGTQGRENVGRKATTGPVWPHVATVGRRGSTTTLA